MLNADQRARVYHLLVDNETFCQQLKTQIHSLQDLDRLAREHSQCPSARVGGDIGIFGPGKMALEFDEVVFNNEIGQIHGPVKTAYGYHLIWIARRR